MPRILNCSNRRVKLKFALASYFVIKLNQEKKKPNRTVWVSPWLEKRLEQGAYANLMAELRLSDANAYRNFIRMDTGSFETLLQLVTPIIRKEDTKFRQSIEPAERLAITLRFLATGRTN
jgi:hypothetical protein